MYQGKLVRLRAFEMDDVNDNHFMMNDYSTQRSMTSNIPFPVSREDERQWLSHQSRYTRGEYQFAIENAEGDLVGRCGPVQVDWKNRVAEVAIMIGALYRGQGYGREAMELLCDFCDREMNLHRLKVTVFAFNEAALRTYQHCGFVQEGVLREEIFRDGAYQDVIMMGRINPKEKK